MTQPHRLFDAHVVKSDKNKFLPQMNSGRLRSRWTEDGAERSLV